MAAASPLMMSPASNIFRPRNNVMRSVLVAIFCLVLLFFTLRPTADQIRNIPQQLEQQVTGSHTKVKDPPATQKPTEIQGEQQNEELYEEPASIPPSHTAPLLNASMPQICVADVEHLRSLRDGYELGDNIEYARREIRFHRQDIPRYSMTKLDQELFPAAFDPISLGYKHDEAQGTNCLAPLRVPVTNSPLPGDVDGSEFLFGISTTFERLNDPTIGPIKEWSHWLTNGKGESNGAGLILRLVDATDRQIIETQTKLQQLGIDVKVYQSDSSIAMAQRYLSLLPALHSDDSIPDRRWLVMCDDDTFFPSMNALKARLSVYDTDKDLYLGTLSEDVLNVQRHGSQAFGGAGVFFTRSLAARISQYHSKCGTDAKLKQSDHGWGSQGDIMLRMCIYENTEVRMTAFDDLWQLDLFGDPAGFYEGGLMPSSVHHFKGGMWHHAKPYAGAYVSSICGEDCYLQRFQTADNFIISNGYSVAHYPKGIDFDTNLLERTFDAAPDDLGWNFDYSFGPQRRSLSATGRKAAWELKESVLLDDGSMRQSYVRRAKDRRWNGRPNGGAPLYEKDGVIDLVWMPAS